MFVLVISYEFSTIKCVLYSLIILCAHKRTELCFKFSFENNNAQNHCKIKTSSTIAQEIRNQTMKWHLKFNSPNLETLDGFCWRTLILHDSTKSQFLKPERYMAFQCFDVFDIPIKYELDIVELVPA